MRTRLELEPNVSVMKCARNKTTCARSVELFVDVHVVKRHAIVDVLCRPVVNVVIGVHIVVLFVPLVIVHFVVLILLVVILYQFIPLFSRSHFSHMFSLYSQGILGVVFTETKRKADDAHDRIRTYRDRCGGGGRTVQFQQDHPRAVVRASQIVTPMRSVISKKRSI